jgi:hypothetical protein
VNEVNLPPVLAFIANQTVNAGAQVLFTATATDPDLPSQALTFALDTPPTGAGIDPATGQFTWVTSALSATTTNRVTVRVTDSGTPALSDTQAVQVIIIAAPRFTSITNNGGGTVTLAWQSVAGKTYRVLWTADLSSSTWTPLGGDFLAIGPISSKTDSTAAGPQRFYRVLQVD